MFLMWFSANLNILTYVCSYCPSLFLHELRPRLTTGTAGPAFYGLGIQTSLLVILVVDIVRFSALHLSWLVDRRSPRRTCTIPAFL